MFKLLEYNLKLIKQGIGLRRTNETDICSIDVATLTQVVETTIQIDDPRIVTMTKLDKLVS
jgi:hypothetical protein